ncbi:MAG: fused MFS/spermidine synthase, partial [Anaerolineales bacterium]|nr:fused MFS/spermidine synthase [Anaerolineales bacterium]
VLVLFIVPITLLGTVSPFAIRLALRDSRQAGVVSGRIYAISTLGSFIGTFLPTLILIPLIGTTYTFLVFSALLTLVALIGLGRSSGWREPLRLAWMPLVLLVLGMLWGSGAIKQTSGQVYESESAYNYIQVVEDQDGSRLLRLNEGQGVHSIYHPDRLAYYGPWMQFLAAPFFNPAPFGVEQVERIAIIGLAAGTTARQATEVFGPVPIDGYEIDPEIIRVGQEYFAMTETNLNPIAQDGRVGLAYSQETYTLIGVDAYRPPYIPWHLTTREFFQLVHDRLDSNGVLVINVGRAPDDRRLIDGLVGTIASIFPAVYVMDVPQTFNSIVYATANPSQITDLHENFRLLVNDPTTHPLLLEAINRAIVYQQPVPDADLVFTDDWAPIEWLTNDMVLRYVLFGDVEDLMPVE